jgi:glyoxylase-like metal-dependent hydrolase (beta-lactamase superfamily II)
MSTVLDAGAVQVVPNSGWDDRVHLFQLGRLVTSFAVVSQRYVVLIDTLVNPATSKVVLATIAPLLHGRQLLVINTHADWDHCWGNQVFGGLNAPQPAPIIGHRLCRERLLSADARAELAQMQQDTPQSFADVHLVPPTICFDHGLTIDGGDLTFELIATPGHQPDHLSIWIPELATIFAGDAAELPLPYVAHWHALPQLRSSLGRLQELNASTAFYCHARTTHSPDLLRANSEYFDELEHHCVVALIGGRVPSQIDAVADPEQLIGYPLSAVPGSDQLDADERASYHATHQTAIRAMLTWLRYDDEKDDE